GTTRIFLTKIPFFKEVIVSSFSCESCGVLNSELQPGGKIQEKGVKYSVKIKNQKDLNRQVVQTNSATVSIPELQFEIPPNKGVLTTVEGILDKAIEGLSQDQPLRKIQHPEAAAQIEQFIQTLQNLRAAKQEFTIVLDDPSGNSFVENPYPFTYKYSGPSFIRRPQMQWICGLIIEVVFLGEILISLAFVTHAPSTDPAASVHHYTRTKEQNEMLGIYTEVSTQSHIPFYLSYLRNARMSTGVNRSKQSSNSIEKYLVKTNMTTRRSSQVGKSSEKHAESLEKQKEGDPLTLIREDLKKINEKLEETVKSTHLQELVTNIVSAIVKKNREEIEKEIEEKVEKRCSEIEKVCKTRENDLNEKIDGLNMDITNLREKLVECNTEMVKMKSTLIETVKTAQKAEEKANYNEQYSRKNNIKIYGVKEDRRENTEERVIQLLSDKAGVKVNPDEILAVHRIPKREKDMHKPILLKLKNTDSKAKIMRKRKQVRENSGGVRLADDVTFYNTKLISRLQDHRYIDSAWYFNGYVYGQSGETRYKFNIHDDIDRRLKSKR
ncbi:hypothetical protein FSP39_009061, partial [Pinctada imbricata]